LGNCIDSFAVDDFDGMVFCQKISGKFNKNKISYGKENKLFGKQQIRSVWDEENEKWYFSIVDVVGVSGFNRKKLYLCQ
jgi:hypothetical protein